MTDQKPPENSVRGAVVLLIIGILSTYFGAQIAPLKDVVPGLSPPLQAALNWILGPTLLPRGLFLVGLVATWFAAAYFFNRKIKVVFVPPAAPQAPPQEPEIEDFEPTRVQVVAAAVINDRYYPRPLQLADLAAAMARYVIPHAPMPVAPQGEIAREMENLRRRGVAAIDEPDSPMAYYGLTPRGRDFMLDKARASQRQRSQPVPDPRRF